MQMSWSARIATIGLVSCLATGGLIRQADAGTGSIVSARIDGKRFKSTSRRLTFGQYGSFSLLVFGSKRVGRSVRSMGFGCVPIDLATATLPLTCNGNGNYQDVHAGHRPSAKGWGTVGGLRVTIEGFDGSRVRGTFSGTFDFGNENGTRALAPIAVEDGRFDVKLR
jgi:hypothetical protein